MPHSWDISFFACVYTDADSGCVSYNSIVLIIQLSQLLSPSYEGPQYDHKALRLAVS